MARITIEVDLIPEVEITGYQRYQDGHGLEVRWPLPARCRCEKCGHDDVAHIEFKTSPQAIRDLNLWEQLCFWIYQAPFHRCARCNYRQHIIPPFKRKDVSYTYRFEQFVLRSLIGSTAEEVARRLGISAETVDRIVENQLTEDRQIDPQRVITDIGLDELSLKKRHRLYVTLMTDLRVCSKSLCCGPSPWSLVPKPIPVLRPGQPTEHQLNHADPDLRLAGISQVFIILAVNPAPTQPAEGSLHHPPPRQQLKPSVPGRSADDLNHIPPVLRDPSVQGVIVVLGVRPQLPQARERFSRQLAEDLRCRRRIIHGRTGHGHG